MKDEFKFKMRYPVDTIKQILKNYTVDPENLDTIAAEIIEALCLLPVKKIEREEGR